MIQFGELEIPDSVYERAIDGCRVDGDGHWIWYGAKSGKQLQPQIGCTIEIDGEKKTKVISVAKLLFVVQYKVFPWQVRRVRERCQNKLCVNPKCHYAILEKPEPRAKGNRGKRVERVYYG